MLAVGGGELAAEHAHQRRLAGAVGADDAVAVAGGKLEIDILKERLFYRIVC